MAEVEENVEGLSHDDNEGADADLDDEDDEGKGKFTDDKRSRNAYSTKSANLTRSCWY